jgi:hypothetical protein
MIQIIQRIKIFNVPFQIFFLLQARDKINIQIFNIITKIISFYICISIYLLIILVYVFMLSYIFQFTLRYFGAG